MARNQRRRLLIKSLRLAKELGAEASAVMITEPFARRGPRRGGDRVPWLKTYEEDAAAQRCQMPLSGGPVQQQELGVACDTKHLSDHYPAEGIVAYAKERNCDLIVMGSHGRRGLSRLLLGSQASEV